MRTSRFGYRGPCCCGLILLASCFLTQDRISAQSPNQELQQRLQAIALQMKSVGQSLQAAAPDGTTLKKQQQVLNELNLLVRQFSAGEQSGGADANSQAASGSTTQSGSTPGAGQASATGAEGEPTEVLPEKLSYEQLIRKAWGSMPVQPQDPDSQSLSPQFLPGFERLIREYYLRMSR